MQSVTRPHRANNLQIGWGTVGGGLASNLNNCLEQCGFCCCSCCVLKVVAAYNQTCNLITTYNIRYIFLITSTLTYIYIYTLHTTIFNLRIFHWTLTEIRRRALRTLKTAQDEQSLRIKVEMSQKEALAESTWQQRLLDIIARGWGFQIEYLLTNCLV